MKEKDRLNALKQSSTILSVPDDAKAKERRRSSRSRQTKRSPYSRMMLQAGIEMQPRSYLIACASISFVVGYLAHFVGPLLAVFITFALFYYLSLSLLEERAEKRKNKVIPQLPPFLDALVSSLGSGLNLEAAVVQATLSVPPGTLRSELDRVSSALEMGFGVRDAFGILKDRISGREITSLAVSLSLFSSMGGHVLEPFERLGKKIREQHQVAERAGRDLVMVKQSFFIMLGLALLVPAVLMIAQPSYLSKAFSDPVGKIILQVGQILVLSSVVLFKKMTSIKI